MKNLYIYIIIATLITGMFSCGDNEDFSSLHVLTEAEIAEMARQDSIEEAAKNKIDADLVLEYSVDIDVSEVLYDGTTLAIDLDQIAELFEISTEELLSGIEDESVKGFAIDSTTHADYASSSTTGSVWGHWWDANGDVTEWSSSDNLAVCFAEFDTEAGEFYIGQYPDRLEIGQTVPIIEALKYNEKRVAVTINVNGVDPASYTDPETAPEGDPEDLSVDITLSKEYSDDYASITAEIKESMRNAFKMTTYQIHNAIDSADLKLYVGEISETDPEYTADSPGYWINEDGTSGVWAESMVYLSIGHSKTELYLYGGNHPDNALSGGTVNTKLIATCNGGSVTFNITFEVGEYTYTDPETAPEGDPEDLIIDLTMSKSYSDDYAIVSTDIKETMRTAFKMTTFQIHSAMNSGELKLYQGEISETDPDYTATSPGYWLSTDGSVVAYADGIAFFELGHSETELVAQMGNHPDNGLAGSSLTTKMIATCNGGSVTFNVTFDVE